MDAGSDALSVMTGETNNIGPTTSKALTVTLTARHPRVALLTVVAPSPDWFVGVCRLTPQETGLSRAKWTCTRGMPESMKGGSLRCRTAPPRRRELSLISRARANSQTRESRP